MNAELHRTIDSLPRHFKGPGDQGKISGLTIGWWLARHLRDEKLEQGLRRTLFIASCTTRDFGICLRHMSETPDD